jgi:hypothetical protein
MPNPAHRAKSQLTDPAPSSEAVQGRVQRSGQHRPRVRAAARAFSHRTTSCGAAARVWVSPCPAALGATCSRRPRTADSTVQAGRNEQSRDRRWRRVLRSPRPGKHQSGIPRPPERSLLRKLPRKRIVIRSVIIGPLDPGNDRIPTGAVRAAHQTVIPHLIAYLMLYYFRLTCKSANNSARLSGRG